MKHDISIIVEEGKNNYSAYIPSMPGCVATGKTIEETYIHIFEAAILHIKGKLDDKENKNG